VNDDRRFESVRIYCVQATTRDTNLQSMQTFLTSESRNMLLYMLTVVAGDVIVVVVRHSNWSSVVPWTGCCVQNDVTLWSGPVDSSAVCGWSTGRLASVDGRCRIEHSTNNVRVCVCVRPRVTRYARCCMSKRHEKNLTKCYNLPFWRAFSMHFYAAG
jgi:hypothetical protein